MRPMLSGRIQGGSARLLSRRRTRRLLNRLSRALRRRGWATERRYNEAVPLLRVFNSKAPCIGESISIRRLSERGRPWFASSTGMPLGPCLDVEFAADEVDQFLATYVDAALAPPQEQRP